MITDRLFLFNHLYMLQDILTKLSPCNGLAQKVSSLEQENADLKKLLVTKQEHINETNKYWKKKLHEVKRKVKYVRTDITQL